jgi:hypothetical protein
MKTWNGFIDPCVLDLGSSGWVGFRTSLGDLKRRKTLQPEL